MSARAWPVELVFSAREKVLRISFDDGAAAEVPYRVLRRESPSAEVRGHGGTRPLVEPPMDIDVLEAQPVGRYAVRLAFSDGHSTGIYSWDYLRELGERAA